MRLVTLLPKLHIALRGVDVISEKQLIVELETCIRHLVESEKDRDVQAEMAKFFHWVNEQEAARTDPEYNKRLQEEEEADRRKEEEESATPIQQTTVNVGDINRQLAGNLFPPEGPDPKVTSPAQPTPTE